MVTGRIEAKLAEARLLLLDICDVQIAYAVILMRLEAQILTTPIQTRGFVRSTRAMMHSQRRSKTRTIFSYI